MGSTFLEKLKSKRTQMCIALIDRSQSFDCEKGKILNWEAEDFNKIYFCVKFELMYSYWSRNNGIFIYQSISILLG